MCDNVTSNPAKTWRAGKISDNGRDRAHWGGGHGDCGDGSAVGKGSAVGDCSKGGSGGRAGSGVRAARGEEGEEELERGAAGGNGLKLGSVGQRNNMRRVSYAYDDDIIETISDNSSCGDE